MAKNSSATAREQAPHPTQTPHVHQTSRTNTIINALKRRAQAVLNDKSIDPQTRAIIRYGLETNDPWLAELVRRADAGESIVDQFDFSQTPETNRVDLTRKTDDVDSTSETNEDDSTSETNKHDSNEKKIEALAEIICRAGDESRAALLVLMATLENSTHPKALANTVKHFAFTRCGELNLYGMVDAQIAVLEHELFADDTPVS